MAEITGRIIGAYREEGFILDNNGNPVDLVHILNMILNGGADVNANNGLNVDGGFVQLGGTLIEDTYIDSTNKFLFIGFTTPTNKSFLSQDPANKTFYVGNADLTNKQNLYCKPDEFTVQVTNAANIGGQVGAAPDQASISHGPTNGDPVNTSITCYENQVVAEGVRSYANTAAAQADGTFLIGGLYTITTEPTILRIKHA